MISFYTSLIGLKHYFVFTYFAFFCPIFCFLVLTVFFRVWCDQVITFTPSFISHSPPPFPPCHASFPFLLGCSTPGWLSPLPVLLFCFVYSSKPSLFKMSAAAVSSVTDPFLRCPALPHLSPTSKKAKKCWPQLPDWLHAALPRLLVLHRRFA